MQRQSFFLVPLICLSSALWAAPATVNVEVLQDKLDHPWALAFLPDNHGMLITLRGGELRRWQAGKGLSAPLSGVPEVWAHGQGGLMDVALAPDFAQSRRIWLSYSEVGDDGKAGTAVGYGRLSDDLSKVTDFRTVFRQMGGWYSTVKVIFLLLWAKTISARRRRIWINYRANWCVLLTRARSRMIILLPGDPMHAPRSGLMVFVTRKEWR